MTQMNSTLLSSVMLSGLLTLGASVQALAQTTLYKCADEKGVTHYGETMPTACAKKEITELSKQGRTLRKLDAPLTAEQQKARDEGSAKKIEADKRVSEQRQKDLALLGTYGAEREIDVLRDKDLAQLDQRRAFLEKRVVDVDARLEKINNQMEFYIAGKSKSAKTKDGKDAVREVPTHLQADFDRANSDRANLKLEIASLDVDKTDTSARYEVEKERFRRLKGGLRPGTILDDKGNVLIEAPMQRRVAPPLH